MGKDALGVFYGCVVPKGLELRDSEDALLDKWEKSKSNRKLGLTTVNADKHLLGFWVALGGDKDNVRDISDKCIPLTVIERTPEALKAVVCFKLLVRFAHENGINLPLATFWLAPV